jgi:hypothetical protein
MVGGVVGVPKGVIAPELPPLHLEPTAEEVRNVRFAIGIGTATLAGVLIVATWYIRYLSWMRDSGA